MKSILKVFTSITLVLLIGCIGSTTPVSVHAEWITESHSDDPPYFYIENYRGDALAFGCFDPGEPGDGVRFFVELYSDSLAWVSEPVNVEHPSSSLGFSRWHPNDENDPNGLVLLFQNDDHLLSAVEVIGDWLSLEVEGTSYLFHTRGIEQQSLDLLVRCRLFESQFVDDPYRTPEASNESAPNQSEYGDTPLHAAIRDGDDARARSLIATMTRADLCTKNALEQTPYDLATIFDLTNIQLILMQLEAAYQCRR
ncbi:hypothetical protein [Thioalkalivibrio sp. HK1]|uniref:hypothetical protein n=1 Tax=Thioalkalivibrio sp. HK1 TaxID=1469245 RepID=UPI000471CAD8|nr:hypothetical protein [Thioalkalivibrio sp. HK1]